MIKVFGNKKEEKKVEGTKYPYCLISNIGGEFHYCFLRQNEAEFMSTVSWTMYARLYKDSVGGRLENEDVTESDKPMILDSEEAKGIIQMFAQKRVNGTERSSFVVSLIRELRQNTNPTTEA